MSTPAKGPSTPIAKSARQNSVGFGQKELDLLLNEIDDGAAEDRRRGFVRWPFRQLSIPCKIIHPGGNSANILVACRNISCGGMSFLHNTFIYQNSRCVLTLPHPKQGKIEVSGTVIRCTHRRGVIHEIGVRFDKQINARELFVKDPFSDWFSLEHVNPEELRGTVVHVDDSPLDRKLILHYFRGTQVRLLQANTVEEGIEMAAKGCDLILCDFDLGTKTGADLVLALRAQSIRTPVILLTSDTTAQTRDRGMQVNADAFLTKPVSQPMLLRAAAEFLVVGGTADVQISTLAANHPNRVLIGGFVEQMGDYCKRLQIAIQREDAATVRSICLQISGAAPAVGFDRLAKLAAASAAAVAASMSVNESIVSIRALLAACESASKSRVVS